MDANTDARDGELLAAKRRKVRAILEDAELTMWELEDAGWQTPGDAPDGADYAARLLFCCADTDELVHAIALVREIVLRDAVQTGAE